MKKTLLALLTFFSISLSVIAQNYYHLRSDGNLPNGYYLDKIYESSKRILLNEPNNESMSVIDRLPFDFNFYGNTYRSYRVSDNGYLSFDTLSISSQKPGNTYPANSIIPFWKDFKLQKLPAPNEGVGIQVFSYTDGVAPNRKHIVQWFGISLASDNFTGPITNASIYAFAIIFHEGNEGRFDLVYTPYGDKSQKAVIGCTNADNSSSKLLNDSLSNLPFQFSFDKNKFMVYQFIYGSQPDYDLSIKNLNVASIYPVNAIVNFSGTLSNNGTQTINDFKLNYSINQGDTISFDINGQNLLPNGEGVMTFSHPLSWTSGAAGSLNNVNFFLSHPNGMMDEDSANSHYAKTVLRNTNNYTAPRRILFEEGTGAWCGYCPEAHLILSEAKSTYGDKVIPVSYHFDDSMTTPSGDIFLSNYFSSYPDAMLDRKVMLGSNNTWLSELAARLNGNAPVEISIDMKSFNVQTREISYRVRARFSDYWYGNLTLGSIVTEDKVRGNALANIWSQNNYYSQFHNGGVGGASHPLYNEKEYMDGYVHKSVVKAMPGGVWGMPGILPQYITPNSEFSQTFTYILPEAAFVNYTIDNNTQYCSTIDAPGQNEGRNIPANINLVAYVAENDSDVYKRAVINAGEVKLWNLSSINSLVNSAHLNVYPNPADNQITLGFNSISEGAVTLTVSDLNGKILLSDRFENLSAGPTMLYADISQLPSGIYSVQVKSDTQLFTNQLIKQ
ncbi:MAG: Omp28-related outer membrane protein [Chitinophagaceae bacterium]